MSAKSKIFIGLGIFLVVLFVALLSAPVLVDVNHYRPQIEAKLREKLGRNVSLGPMKLSLVPFAFRVENAAIGEDPRFDTGSPFAQVETLFVSPQLWPLLHKEVQIKSLQLTRPSVEFIRNRQGVWNFSSLGKDNTGQTQPFSLTDLKIYNGQIAITDAQQQKPRAVYDHIDIVASDFARDRAFPVDVRAHLPGSGEQTVVWQGKIGPIDHDAIARTPFDGKLKLASVSMNALDRFVNGQALGDSDGTLTGSADVKNNAGTLASSGNFDIENARIRGVNFGYPIGINYEFNANLNDSTVAIQKANLRLGRTPVSVNGTINAQPTPAQIDLNIQASDASIAEAARLAAAFGAAFNAKTDVTGTLNANVHAKGSANKPSLSGNVAARNVRVTGGDLREPVQADAVELTLAPDAIRSNAFTAKTGRTGATVQFALMDYASDIPKVDATLNTSNAELQELLRIAHAYGISAVDGIQGSGSLTLDVSAKGPMAQPDQMAFSGTGAIRNASLQMSDVTKAVSVPKADLRFSGNGVALDNLDFSVGQTTGHGNAVVRDFHSPKVQFSIAANRVNVAEWEQLFQGGTQKAGTQPSGQPRTAAPQDSLINRTTGTGSLSADTVVYDDLTLSNLQASISLDHGIITMNPMSANLYNGRETGKVVVNTRTRPVTYSVDSKLDGVDANQLLSAVSPIKQALYGILSANADTHFTTSAGARSILSSLNGKVGLNLRDGKIANVDLLHQLASIAQFNRTARAVEPFTQLVQMTGNFDIENGVARTNNLKAVIPEGSVAASGAVDLAAQRLNLRLTVVLSDQFSQAVGGTGIGGFLNTALANRDGELVIPVVVTGTFQSPQFAPDIERVARMKLENLVPTANDPTGLTKGILGQIFRQKPTEEESQPNQNQPNQKQEPKPPANPLEEIFKLFPKK